MPFTKILDRINALKGIIKAVGDLCFLHYLPMKRVWNKSRRWTTAHNTYRDLYGLTDDQAAKDLAWQVHFVLNVIPYEIEKRAENGDVLDTGE